MTAFHNTDDSEKNSNFKSSQGGKLARVRNESDLMHFVLSPRAKIQVGCGDSVLSDDLTHIFSRAPGRGTGFHH